MLAERPTFTEWGLSPRYMALSFLFRLNELYSMIGACSMHAETLVVLYFLTSEHVMFCTCLRVGRIYLHVVKVRRLSLSRNLV